MLQNIKKKTEGFTIIEVMIVLAIAALIMVIVLVAVPQLQRNQRNAARRDVLGRVKTEVDNFAGNNNGTIPTQNNNATTGFSGGFQTRYLTNVNYQDPQTGANMTLTPQAASAGGVPGSATGAINYTVGALCNGELATTTGATGRNYAIYTLLEGGATFCLDNR